MGRTVSYDIEYWQDAVEHKNHKYNVNYIINRESRSSHMYDSYEDAFHVAVKFANLISDAEDINKEAKEKIISSVYIYDCTEGRDVTTAELKNILLEIKNSL